jgi:hypothetical protein
MVNTRVQNMSFNAPVFTKLKLFSYNVCEPAVAIFVQIGLEMWKVRFGIYLHLK